MVRRLVLGEFNDGVTIGVRCSLPGIDALTGDSSVGGTFSFDSSWTDITQTLLIGTATKPSTGSSLTSLIIGFPNPGYVPFCEIRQIAGNVVYDDGRYGNAGNQNQLGIGAEVTTTTLTPCGLTPGASCLYIVHKVPVMSG